MKSFRFALVAAVAVSMSACSTMIAKNPHQIDTVVAAPVTDTTSMSQAAPAPTDSRQIAREALRDLSNDLHFASNEDVLNGSARTKLESLAKAVSSDPALRIRIEGYADSTGAPKTNQTLSARRAQAVASILKQNGVPANRISALGRSTARPVANNATPAGRAENRRAEISFN